MKITSLRCYAVPTPVKAFVFIALDTDAGITGFGEATLDDRWRSVVAAVCEGFDYLAGRDPRDVELHWHTLETKCFWGGGVVGRSALSAIDQALWDISGKAVGLPVHRLWGARLHDRVNVYFNQWWRGAGSTEELIAKARLAVDRGATALKWYPIGFTPDIHRIHRLRDHAVEAAVAEVHAVRAAVGPRVALMVDLWRGLDWASAGRFCAAIEDCDLLFVEEPLDYVDPDSFVRLAASTRTRIAGGERLYSRREFAPYLHAGAFGVAQPSLIRVGGLTEARKIAQLAETAGIGVSPHNPYGPVATAAAIQLSVTLPNLVMLESYENDFPAIKRDFVIEGFEVHGDHFELSDRPGLGVTLDEQWLRARAEGYAEKQLETA